MKKSTRNLFRNWHRDVGYFYVGLIIAFSISGIALNHRTSFDPQEYTVKTEAIQLPVLEGKELNDDFFREASKQFTEETYRGFRKRGNSIRLYYKDAFASVDPKTGKGEIEFVRTIPVLGQMTILHKTTNVWWIWFSDIFGVAMLVIAISGMFISKGKYSFKQRGWWLATIGLVFPFIFLFLIR
ncbi:PepSY-associated TM helix domain-containing protein [Aquimarina rhabdastrellae]